MLGFLQALINGYTPSPFVAARPSIVKEQIKVAIGPARGRKGRQVYALREVLVDRTRYPGHVLREIRKQKTNYLGEPRR